jgi:hypothetical protein
VTAEGGLEAAIEAPFIFSALDSLAARAKKWTELRAQVGGPLGGQEGGPRICALVAGEIQAHLIHNKNCRSTVFLYLLAWLLGSLPLHACRWRTQPGAAVCAVMPGTRVLARPGQAP